MASTPSIFLRRFLASGALLGAAWGFHREWIVPLHHREIECRQALADVRQRLSDAKATISGIRGQVKVAADAHGLLESLQSDVPTAPTAVWLPVRLTTHLDRSGIAKATMRLNAVEPDSGVIGYERTYWHLNLPKQPGMRNMGAVLLAVAEIERQEPFVRVLDLSLRTDTEEPHWPAGGFNVTALVPK